ncbi:MAG: sulfur carrier protein ThiS [Rubricoccaceae bacterium]|nr:sulfur carrier protein ThiS [Rubricoccaceae bacterium]
MSETITTIGIQLNGQARDIPDGLSVVELLRHIGRLPDTPGVAVAVNDAVVHKTSWSKTRVHAGDRVELITASQGG